MTDSVPGLEAYQTTVFPDGQKVFQKYMRLPSVGRCNYPAKWEAIIPFGANAVYMPSLDTLSCCRNLKMRVLLRPVERN